MARLTVNVLGGFQASLDSGAPCTLSTKKAQALLAYLALAPGRVCPRPALASLLWGERGDAQALKSLRQTVYTLRQVVEKIDPSVLLLEGGIAANPAALDVDAIRFERLVKEGTPLALDFRLTSGRACPNADHEPPGPTQPFRATGSGGGGSDRS